MGTRGPIPKPIDQRLGHITQAEKDNVTSVHVTGEVEVPPADPGWHELARDWYESLARSGQSRRFEPSDWAAARLLAHEISRALGDGMTASMMGRLWSAMGDLMTTEGSRLRARLEVRRTLGPAEKQPPAPSGDGQVVNLDDFRDFYGA